MIINRFLTPGVRRLGRNECNPATRAPRARVRAIPAAAAATHDVGVGAGRAHGSRSAGPVGPVDNGKERDEPAMRAAREQKKKEKAGTRSNDRRKGQGYHQEGPAGLKREIALLKGDIANNTGMFEEREKNVSDRVEFLESMLKKRQAVDKRARAASQQKEQEPMFNLKILQSMRQGDLQIEDKGAGGNDEGSDTDYEKAAEQQGLGDGGGRRPKNGPKR